MADVARDAHAVGCSAWRRRNRRLRAFWRHEQQAVRMAVAAATHHSYDRSSAHACTQTDLVPQMVDNVLDALRLLDLPIAEQVIDVPKFFCSACPSRCPIPEPQTADQLVEVPTVLTPTRIALRIAEQIVSTPVPRSRGQGFHPEQSSTASSSYLERISERTVEQIVDISPSGVGLGQGTSSSSSARPAEEDFIGSFRTFPMEKSAECRAQCGPAPAHQLMDPGGFCAAQGVP